MKKKTLSFFIGCSLTVVYTVSSLPTYAAEIEDGEKTIIPHHSSTPYYWGMAREPSEDLIAYYDSIGPRRGVTNIGIESDSRMGVKVGEFYQRGTTGSAWPTGLSNNDNKVKIKLFD